MSTLGRGLMPGTATPHPLGAMLPGLFQDNWFALKLCAALDEVLVPVVVSLDCLDTYFDPALTPPDFLDWLAGWVGLALDQNWSDDQRRALVQRAADLYRWQGTVKGVAEHVKLYTGVQPDVRDSGGVAWSAQADGPLPGVPVLELRVTVAMGPDDQVNMSDLDTVVAAAKPAHVPHLIEIIKAG
jgi:phage tail-like protein